MFVDPIAALLAALVHPAVVAASTLLVALSVTSFWITVSQILAILSQSISETIIERLKSCFSFTLSVRITYIPYCFDCTVIVSAVKETSFGVTPSISSACDGVFVKAGNLAHTILSAPTSEIGASPNWLKIRFGSKFSNTLLTTLFRKVLPEVAVLFFNQL